MKKFLYAILAVSTLAFASCTKEEDEIEIDVSKNGYLTKSYWQVTSVMVNPDFYAEGSFPTEEFTNLPLCFRDDIYEFTTDSKFIIDENHVKCNANNPQQKEYFYNIINSDKGFKVWSNPDDPDASLWFNGEIETFNIDKFTTTSYNVVNDKTIQTVTTYESIRRKPKK